MVQFCVPLKDLGCCEEWCHYFAKANELGFPVHARLSLFEEIIANRDVERCVRYDVGFDGDFEIVGGKWYLNDRSEDDGSVVERLNSFGCVLDFADFRAFEEFC